MSRKLIQLLMLVMLTSCGQFKQGGITNKRELRSKKAPSVKIAEEYDKKAKKNSTKTYKNPKRQAKARDKQTLKHKKKADRYLKKKRKKVK